ncbi:MAG: type II toxin-antitoxin system HicA family toxin [Armatimonadetes bacterium]|nr:type II toxin-antitoxin system HicA family toxin [Armatimonadota bacterium]
MPRLPRITAKQVIKALKRAGWMVDRTSGSHVQFRHPSRPGTVTVPKHPGEILIPKLLMAILEQAGLSVDELVSLL